jgi:hypothetical protein
MTLIAGSVAINIDADIQKMQSSFSNAGKMLDNFGKNTINKARGIASSIGDTLKTGITVGLGAGIGLGGLAVKQFADMEKMGVSLKTSLGGSEEEFQKVQKEIIKFSTKTPYALAEAQQAFISLKNYGLDPSMEALTSYGDMASAMGKPLQAMIEAMADASSGEFERLKEFGIKSAKEKDKVSFTFKGVTTTIKNSSENIQKYIQGIAKSNFAGGMDAQSKTLSGRITTLVDTINLKLGELINNSGVGQFISDLTLNISNFIDGLDPQVVVSYLKQMTDGIQFLFVKAFEFYNWVKPSLPIIQEIFVTAFIAIYESLKFMYDLFVVTYNFLRENEWILVSLSFILATLAGVVLASLISAMIAFGVATWTAMAPLLPFIAIVAGVALAVGLLYLAFKDNFESIGKVVKSVFDFIGAIIVLTLKQARNPLNGFINMINTIIKGYNMLPSELRFGTLPEIPNISSFRSGVSNFEGGFAKVHEGETLKYLPKGTDVDTRNETMNNERGQGGQPNIIINVPTGSFVNAQSLDDFFKMAKTSAKKQGFAVN